MKPFPYFTTASKVELAHDSGFKSSGVAGTFDGRPAHILQTLDTLIEGHGASVLLTWANGKTVWQHGRLYLKQEPDRATFAVDMTEEPQGFKQAQRAGVVRVEGHGFTDDTGPFFPLGTTLFWAVGGWMRGEQDRVRQHFAFVKAQGYDYVRILGQVGWTGEAIDPWSSAYQQALGEVIDAAAAAGLRVQLTAIGGKAVKPVDAARRMALVLRPRLDKVLMLEAVNEGNASPETAVEIAKVFAGVGVPFGVGLGDQGIGEIEECSAESRSTVAYYHTSRTDADNGARQVRQAWDFKEFKRASVHNEGPGPASSGTEFKDPFKLAAMRAAAIVCGAGAFCFHTGAGVFGRRHVASNGLLREANLWEVPNIVEMMAAVKHASDHLPAGIEGWQKFNTNKPVEVASGSVNKLYGARTSGRFVEIVIGAEGPTHVFRAHEACDLQIVNPATGDVVLEQALGRDQTCQVSGLWSYLLVGTTR